jgi:small subunit ribosomal protein S6
MATNTYELTYIVNAVQNEDQIKDTVRRVNKLIEENGGEVVEIDEWGNRRLAYLINKKRTGYYVNMYFRAPGELVARLERAMEIDDDVLRYLTLRMDAKMLRHRELQKVNAAKAEAKAKAEAAAKARAEEDEGEDDED